MSNFLKPLKTFLSDFGTCFLDIKRKSGNGNYNCPGLPCLASKFMGSTRTCSATKSSQQQDQFDRFEYRSGKRRVTPHPLFSQRRECRTADRIKGMAKPKKMCRATVSKARIISIDQTEVGISFTTKVSTFGPGTAKSTHTSNEDVRGFHERPFSRTSMNFGRGCRAQT
jgi:hypothetical protein